MILPAGSERPAREAALISRTSEVVELTTSQRLKIETSPGGEELLDVVVPLGKHWSVGITVTVTETDA